MIANMFLTSPWDLFSEYITITPHPAASLDLFGAQKIS